MNEVYILCSKSATRETPTTHLWIKAKNSITYLIIHACTKMFFFCSQNAHFPSNTPMISLETHSIIIISFKAVLLWTQRQLKSYYYFIPQNQHQSLAAHSSDKRNVICNTYVTYFKLTWLNWIATSNFPNHIAYTTTLLIIYAYWRWQVRWFFSVCIFCILGYIVEALTSVVIHSICHVTNVIHLPFIHVVCTAHIFSMTYQINHNNKKIFKFVYFHWICIHLYAKKIQKAEWIFVPRRKF